MRTAVVVGGGLSGLSAAFRLLQAGVTVTVLEKDAQPGGRSRTERHGGYVVDTGPDALTESYRNYLGLLSELGLGDRVVPSSPVIGLIKDGVLLDIDPRRPWQLLRTTALSLPAKVRLSVGFLRLRKMMRGVDSYELAQSAALDNPDVTALDLAQGYFGDEVAEYLIDPVMRLTTGSGSREVSGLNVLGALKSWSVPVINVRGGLDVLPAELARRVPAEYGATVTSVDETDTGGVRVGYTDAGGRSKSLEADGCVIGAMYHEGAEIWPELKTYSPEFADRLADVKLISISLGYRVRTRSQAYLVQVPTVELPEALLIFLQHNKAPDRAPDGHSLVTIYTDTIVTDEFLQRDDAELVSWAAGIVESLCPELAGHRDLEVVTRWPKGGYLATPGFWRRSAALLAALPPDGPVQVAGDLFGAGSMESAVRWGERAAARLLARDKPTADK
jgi:protoporphyrinogen/coproporphyrinogen III oxidase